MNITNFQINTLISIFKKVDDYLEDENTLKILSCVNKLFFEIASEIKLFREREGRVFPVKNQREYEILIKRRRYKTPAVSSLLDLKINILVHYKGLKTILLDNPKITSIDISSHNLIAGIVFSNQFEINDFFKTLKYLPNLKKLRIEAINDFLLKNILRRIRSIELLALVDCPNLNHISIKGCFGDWSALEFLLKQKLELEHLELEYSEFKGASVLPYSPKLKYLSLAKSEIFKNIDIESFKNCTSLESLDLSDITPKFTSFDQFPYIETLKNLNCYFAGPIFSDIFSNPNLKNLETLCVDCNAIDINKPLQNFDALKFLGIRILNENQEETLSQIIKHCPNLHTLVIVETTLNSNALCILLSSNIKSLILNNSSINLDTPILVTSQSIDTLICNKRPLEVVPELLDSLPHLKKLHLDLNNISLSAQEKQSVRSLKNLEIIELELPYKNEITLCGKTEIYEFLGNEILNVELDDSLKIPNLYLDKLNQTVIDEEIIITHFNAEFLNLQEIIIIEKYAYQKNYKKLSKLIKKTFKTILNNPIKYSEFLILIRNNDYFDSFDRLFANLNYELLFKEIYFNATDKILTLLVENINFSKIDLPKDFKELILDIGSVLSGKFNQLNKLSIVFEKIFTFDQEEITKIFSFLKPQFSNLPLSNINHIDHKLAKYLYCLILNYNITKILTIPIKEFKSIDSLTLLSHLSPLDGDFKAPIILAAKGLSMDQLIYLDNNGMDFECEFGPEKLNLLSFAILNDIPVLFEFLLKYYPNLVNKGCSKQQLPLFHAMCNLYFDYIEDLIPLTDCKHVTKFGTSMMHLVCESPSLWNYAQMIIEQGTIITQKTLQGHTPLHMLTGKPNLYKDPRIFDMIQLFNVKENHGFNINNMSPFFYACLNWDTPNIKKFYEIASNFIESTNKLGETHLFYLRQNPNYLTIIKDLNNISLKNISLNNVLVKKHFFSIDHKGNFFTKPHLILLQSLQNNIHPIKTRYLQKHVNITNVALTPELLLEFGLPIEIEKYLHDYLLCLKISSSTNIFEHVPTTINILNKLNLSGYEISEMIHFLNHPVFLKNIAIYEEKTIPIPSIDYLTIDGTLQEIFKIIINEVNYQKMESDLTHLFNCVNQKIPYVGTPKIENLESPTPLELKLLNEFYDHLKIKLNHFLDLIFTSKNHEEQKNYILMLAETSTLCATRWDQDLLQYYNTIINKESKETFTFKEELLKNLHQLKLTILREITGDDVHNINKVKYLIGKFIGIHSSYLDPIAINENLEESLVNDRINYLERFLNSYNSIKIFCSTLEFFKTKDDLLSTLIYNFLKKEYACRYNKEYYDAMRIEASKCTEENIQAFKEKYNLLDYGNQPLNKIIDEEQSENFFESFHNNEIFKRHVITCILVNEGVLRKLTPGITDDWESKKKFLKTPIDFGRKRLINLEENPSKRPYKG